MDELREEQKLPAWVGQELRQFWKQRNDLVYCMLFSTMELVEIIED